MPDAATPAAREGQDSNSAIIQEYLARTPGSAVLAGRAAGVLPSGVAHDSRRLKPYSPYVRRAAGARKWDVDGNSYVDYFGGHGALLLGHNRAEVIEAAREALEEGTHFGANHPREVAWAELVCRMVPSAEKVRFTSSGTEATHMALRLARACTGRTRLVRVKGHFHGWHDHMAGGYKSHFDGTPTIGVLPEVAGRVILVEPNDEAGLRAALAQPDVAAAIVEPTGSNFGMVPLRPSFLRVMREETAARGVVLIFDEVVTGFRCAPGGAQEALGITPDMTTLAKILAGGLPGGAVSGRRDILDHLDFDAMAARGIEKIDHPGTFNANPVSAAAGIAALSLIADGEACRKASEFAADLREALNGVLSDEGVPWAAYGTYSAIHVFTNPKGRAVDPRAFDPHEVAFEELMGNVPAVPRLRLALFCHGVDFNGWPGGEASAAHGPAELDETATAFRAAIRMLKAEREIG